MRINALLFFALLLPLTLFGCNSEIDNTELTEENKQPNTVNTNNNSQSVQRTISAEVVALDQPITYNRFGSYNPYGMIYALKRDVIDTESCDSNGNNCKPMSADTKPGHVRLRKDKRPRPLVLRASSGDILKVKFYNMLTPHQPDFSSSETPLPNVEPGMGLTYSSIGVAETEMEIPLVGELELNTPEIKGDAATKGCGSSQAKASDAVGSDWPRTRCASITLSGVTPLGDANNPLVTGLQPIPPGSTIEYAWDIKLSKDQTKRKTSHLFFSHGAPAGGEGDGGSLVHGLFGVLNIEPEGSKWYRSQVNKKSFKHVREQKLGKAYLNYEAKFEDGTPVLQLLKPSGENQFELIYGDLNAVILEKDVPKGTTPAFREFTVVFHDELKTFYADQFKEVGTEFTLSGVGDGFAINYGASGLATMLLANRKKIGPAKDCVNCAYEEFFLESWVNGDPALLADFEDDPSNVHHSYLTDRVEFRNLHAGPKETHVFHLHAHQWLSQETETGTYLDSQTIGPQQGFSYPIYYGGSGNRNKTPGDSIFHCHLYPHFAQGMWELWRVHDVLEDGTRRLPDAELGEGTNLATGSTNPDTGTPIPAIVPLPMQAMAPEPSYGDDGFPGYPFYIAGEVGQRSPQAPYDIKKSAGLGRHVVLNGTRGVSGITAAEASQLSPDEVVAHALRTGDFTSHIETVNLKILPEDGTKLEKTAMNFHSKGKHPSATPEGNSKDFIVNDKPPIAGAPFADPCTGFPWENSKQFVREYNVSAIDTDLIVNRAGWHDPQARINVLDTDVKAFEGEQTDKAVPFFFRANSGDCITFNHTNRTKAELDLDDFQVRTPTDTIGQHIHLVKFDVTSSDGSGNGYNYEDGTFAKEEIDLLIDAANTPEGSAVDVNGNPVTLTKQEGENDFQTTTQRWYADPLLTTPEECFEALRKIPENTGDISAKRKAIWASDKCKDRTIRTVFTHDHFGPSSIQQHGFYSALLVEPRNSKFLTRSGNEMPEEAVGTEAMIIHLNDKGGKEDYREFALAVADFALLYDGNSAELGADKFELAKENLVKQQLSAQQAGKNDLAEKIQDKIAKLNEVLPELNSHFSKIHEKHGKPIDAPKLPEAISKDHHNPYLVNYKNEPVPIRIGCDMDDNKKCKATSDSIKTQLPGDVGDMSNVFSSWVHGDPMTPIFAGFEGEKVQLRLIQGAQEVQHSININGQSWSREVSVKKNDPKAELVSAQEIGISEHFEMDIGLGTVLRGDAFTDYLYNFGSVDDIWNGAWGLIRSVSTNNLDKCKTDNPSDKCKALRKTLDCEDSENCLRPLSEFQNQTNGDNSLNNIKNQSLTVINISDYDKNTDFSCPKTKTKTARKVRFNIAAVVVGNWLGKELQYNKNIEDPDSLAFVVLPFTEGAVTKDAIQGYLGNLRDGYYSNHPLEPLVIRANSGDCIEIALFNMLTTDLSGKSTTESSDKAEIKMGDTRGDALMPKIVPLNVDKQFTSDGAEMAVEDVKPSSNVTLHAQKVFYTLNQNDGANIGWNNETNCEDEFPCHFSWYAGTVSIENCEGDDSQKCAVARAKELGASNLTSYGDIINHPVHGLFGALIIEPKGSTYDCVDENGAIDTSRKELGIGCGIRAKINYADDTNKPPFREFVVFYRDGLNLHYKEGDSSNPIPDCLICDDSYDLGEKGFNYNTEPFWARLGQKPEKNSNGIYMLPELNQAYFPTNFFSEDYKPIATPKFVAEAGDEVRFRVLQPHGRARQRAFMVSGHDFIDMIPEFGSPHAPLISVGKAITARIESANPGVWQYRDGPSHMWSSGAWGIFEVKNKIAK